MKPAVVPLALALLVSMACVLLATTTLGTAVGAAQAPLAWAFLACGAVGALVLPYRRAGLLLALAGAGFVTALGVLHVRYHRLVGTPEQLGEATVLVAALAFTATPLFLQWLRHGLDHAVQLQAAAAADTAAALRWLRQERDQQQRQQAFQAQVIAAFMNRANCLAPRSWLLELPSC